MSNFPTSERSKIRRHPERGSSDREQIHEMLDEGLLAHIAFVSDGQPVVIPMAYARLGDQILFHGSHRSRLMTSLANGRPACVSVTHLDGLVLARSAFHSSMNYRSVVLFGNCRSIEDLDDKRQALDVLVDHLLPGRTAQVRPTTEQELAGTLVLAFRIDEATLKTRSGPPKEPDRDIGFPTWAGVYPLSTVLGEPVPAPDLTACFEPPELGFRIARKEKEARS